jgi:hypothetical protein
MQLWTDYEGVTIDGAFPLKKLLLPEGRSAFFSTTNSRGDQAFLRLIECHFDEEEILARWRSIEALGHPNFLKLERYGQLVMDGGTVVYTAFEKVDASLADVLAQGRLGLQDALQLAASLISALEMLHIHGFIHEHVEPRNVFAVGEVVKLRSDCIREAPEGEAGAEAKRRDIHDFAVLLLEALTRKRIIDDVTGASALPAPFDQIVPNGMSGAWGLAEMQAALHAGRPSRFFSATAWSSPRAASHPADTAPTPRLSPTELQPPAPQKPEGAETRPPSAARPSVSQHRPIGNRKQEVSFRTKLRLRLSPGLSSRLNSRLGSDLRSNQDPSLKLKWAGAVLFVAMLALLAGWFFAHKGSRSTNNAGESALASSRKPAQGIVQAIEHSAPAPVRASLAAAGTRAQWRVIVYTYNHQDEARKKSATLAKKHPELRPGVFTPSGRAPYLVTVGGVMSRNDAFALVRKSRSSGLPRDTYAQNY